MARTLTTAFRNALSETVLRPRFLFEAEIEAATLRYWSGSQDISWNSQTWNGNGFLQGIGNVSLSERTESNGLQITITGEPSALTSIGMQGVRQNKEAKIYLAFLDSSEAIISDPILYFEGILDFVELDGDPDAASIVLSYENILIEDDSENELRYTHETQQTLFAGDLGFEYVEQLEDFSGYWGKPDKSKTKKPGKGGGGAKGQGKGSGGAKTKKTGKKKQKKKKRRR